MGGGANNISNLSETSEYKCCWIFETAAERHFWDRFALRAGYNFRKAANDNQYASARISGPPGTTKEFVTDSIANEFYLGFYIFLGKHFFVGPETGQANTNLTMDRYRFSSTGNGVKDSGRKESVNQTFVGGRIGVQSNVTNHIGVYLDSGVRSYKGAGSFQGGSKFQATGGLMIGF